jgi:hypothetical protein
MATRERHKSIAIPVTGGCRRREVFNPLQCAVRELEEETRGTINLKKGSYSYFKFVTDTPEPRDIEEGATAHNTYHVYIFDLPMTKFEHCSIVQKFTEEKNKMETSQVPYRRNYDENDECIFETLDAIDKKRDLWPMIRKHVLENPEFHKALEFENKTQF